MKKIGRMSFEITVERPTALRWQGLELLTFKQVHKMNRITNAQNTDVSPAIVKQVLAAGFRYVVNISFKGFTEIGFKKVENIAEPVKTLKDAQKYKQEKAQIWLVWEYFVIKSTK